MSLPAIILGAGGHARVVGAILHGLGISIKGYLDESYVAGVEEVIKQAFLIGIPNALQGYSSGEYEVYAAIGDNHKRRVAIEYALSKGYSMPALTHPSAVIESGSQVGHASVICMGVLIATDAAVGKGVILNTGSSVDHETSIGDYCHVAPGAILAGRVKVGREVFVGMGAKIAQNLNIGDGATIGAGAIVLKDVPASTTVVGVYH